MTEVAFASASSIAESYPRAGSAAELVQAIRNAHLNRPVAVEETGFSIANDRIGLARSGQFSARAAAAQTASDNASHASSLLSAADSALADIADKIGTLADLAESASEDGLSSQDYARLDAEFQQVKSEIDALAASTSFDGTALLSGDGSGGPLTITYRVGTDTSASDDITVEVGAASVADLSAALDSATLLSAAETASAATAVDAADDAVGSIRARISGDLTRVNTAYLASLDTAGTNESVRAALADPALAVNLAVDVADQVAREGELPLTAGAEEGLRNLLVKLDPVSMPSTSSDQGTNFGKAEDSRTLQPLTADPAASFQGNGQDQTTS